MLYPWLTVRPSITDCGLSEEEHIQVGWKFNLVSFIGKSDKDDVVGQLLSKGEENSTFKCQFKDCSIGASWKETDPKSRDPMPWV